MTSCSSSPRWSAWPASRGRAARSRLAWALIGAGVLAWAVGEIYYTAVLWEDPAPPLPSPADVGYLLFPPLTMAGPLVLLRARTRGVPRRLLLDGATAALGVTAVSAAIVFETVLDLAEGEPLAVATALAYPLTDLVLLGVVVGALAEHRLVAGPHVDAAGRRRDHVLARRLACTWSRRRRASTSPAAGSTRAGGRA